MYRNILRIDSSAKTDGSVTRMLTSELVERLADDDTVVVTRDLLGGVSLLTAAATNEIMIPAGRRSSDAAPVLDLGDQLIDELRAADAIVIGAPVYNFGVPAALKAWADLVARAGTTFAYSETGPVGLLEDRPVWIVTASGGTPIGSEVDFATSWLQFFLGFLGLKNVKIVAAEGLAMDFDGGVAAGRESIAAVA